MSRKVRKEKKGLFVLQSGHVSLVGNPDRQAGRQTSANKVNEHKAAQRWVVFVQVC